MTVAICSVCGSRKRGALNDCPECRAIPTSQEEQAYSMLLSSHFLDDQGLSDAARTIQSGRSVEFPPEMIEKMLAVTPTEEESDELFRTWDEEHRTFRRKLAWLCALVLLGLLAFAARNAI